MSIKADHWIRRMAQEQGMIEPFVENQVRQGVISYGLSSFGYDIRVADEFRIFSAATGQLSVVDPKLIDERAMVHYQGEVCIIPPNSFALARTMEYFRIPRNVLTICLGKSTYARCFRGDTRVALVDGTAPTLEEMARRAETGELFWGYSIGQFGRVMVTLLEQPRLIGQDALIEIELDNGERIACTPDHEFVQRDGRLSQADALRPGDSLMPLYRKPARGYEMVYQPSNRHLYPTHLLADEWNLRHGLYSNTPGTHRHHIDFERHNNRPALPPIEPAHHDVRLADNHKVTSIRSLPGIHDVYCLTVPEAGNFALESGVFVRNCGIIVNVTPFEPEWEGFVTIEISNTTPLPAKIYANEGIAQVLFFEGEQPDVSYADRKGKYQKQTGITLARP